MGRLPGTVCQYGADRTTNPANCEEEKRAAHVATTLSTGEVDVYDAAVRVLNLQLNPDFERFKLRQARQRDGESIDQFYAQLRELASRCMEDDPPKEIQAQIFQGC
ncbi:hypothetical protein NDU88_006941 [Pleurodeles waltl]|uniref:Retrotransposon gag domain-containing protein n=1 Tax=Pleurodeles waltl TaxID=8319 RepID=A0AAV7WG87_PLEWA|nr:hypothetical protein NDU88_006941 [Pleurodeles waltl]